MTVTGKVRKVEMREETGEVLGLGTLRFDLVAGPYGSRMAGSRRRTSTS